MKLSKLYHVGDLSCARKAPDFSYEGNGLSVSQHPQAWQKIARLGGELYVLKKDDPHFFLAHENSIEQALNWCVEQGYLIPKTKYRAYLTDEDGEEFYFEKDRRHEAEIESEDVRQVAGYIFGPRGRSYWQTAFTSKIDNSQAEAFAIIFFAEAHGYDGVWWNDNLDVAAYSAPRGVIFQEKLKEWHIEKVAE